MERVKKTGRKLNLSFLFKREFKRKIVPLAVMMSLVAFSFVPMATSVPVQDNAAGSWTDSFSDDTGIDLTKSSAIDVSGGNVTFNDAGWTRDDPWGIEIVDSGVGDNSADPSSLKIEVDFNGIPRIVYLDRTNGVFKYACWNGEGWDKQTIPGSLARVDGVIDMAIDGNNNVHIVYSRSQNNSLYYTVWDGSNWSDRIKISAIIKEPVFSVSIAVDSSNIPHVVWPNHNTDPGRMFYTKGHTWVLEPFDSDTYTYNCSINVDSSNNPHIVYADLYGVSTGSNKVDIKHAVKTAGSWDFKIIKEAANSKGFVTPVSAEIDTNNRLWVIYPKWGFWGIGTIYQYLSIDGGSSWDGKIVIQGNGLQSHHNSVDFSGSELGISYKDGSVIGGLKFSVRSLSDNVNDPWSHMLIDPVSNSTYEEAIASGNDGYFHIAYYDLADSGCVKYAGRPLRGTIISKEITPAMIDGWDTFFASDDTASGSVAYSILDGSDFSILKNNVTNGQDISDIDAAAHPTIRLKASISATGSPAVSAILHDWGVTWLPDITSPTLTTEAWIPDDGGTYITDGGTVNLDDIDEAGEKVTIYSTASDASGIQNSKIKWWKNGVFQSAGEFIGGSFYSMGIFGPFNDGDLIEYTFEATDNASPPNTAYDPADGVTRYSFTVISVSATLFADPNSGSAPLNNVDLTAIVGGSATGDITYIFDCDTSVAGTDHTYTGTGNPYAAVDICNYAVANTYTASVEVTRQGITANNTATITVNPPNNLPMMSSVTITPDPAYTNTELTANHIPDIGDVDTDGDPITFSYQWIKNDIPIGGQTNKTLPINNFIKNDIIEVTVTPNDGIGDGLPMTSPALTISNSAPTQPTVSIDPASPVETDNLTCNISIASTDADGDGINYTYGWYKDGALQGGETTNTINLGLTSIGEAWKCKVTPDDGTDNGPSDEASVVISDSSIVQAYSCNSTSIDPCGLKLQNTSIDAEDCPVGYPCAGFAGFLSCLWDIDSGTTTYPVCSDITFSLMIGNHTVDLTVTDQEGLSSSAPQKNLVFKKDAYSDFLCSVNGGVWEKCGDISPIKDDVIDFGALEIIAGHEPSSPSDGASIISYDWNFSDGVGTGATAFHTYTAENPYAVILTVTDSAGRRARRSYVINVGATAMDVKWTEIAS